MSVLILCAMILILYKKLVIMHLYSKAYYIGMGRAYRREGDGSTGKYVRIRMILQNYYRRVYKEEIENIKR